MVQLDIEDPAAGMEDQDREVLLDHLVNQEMQEWMGRPANLDLLDVTASGVLEHKGQKGKSAPAAHRVNQDQMVTVVSMENPENRAQLVAPVKTVDLERMGVQDRLVKFFNFHRQNNFLADIMLNFDQAEPPRINPLPFYKGLDSNSRLLAFFFFFF